jgi:hypothetical protein
MNRAFYLAADAARAADAELPRTVPVRTVTDTVLTELEYAGDLFQRLQTVIDSEMAVLRAAGVKFVGYAPLRASFDLADLSAQVRLQAMLARAGRPA